jgi:tetratricopeptide (TPR) repeat protein
MYSALAALDADPATPAREPAAAPARPRNAWRLAGGAAFLLAIGAVGFLAGTHTGTPAVQPVAATPTVRAAAMTPVTPLESAPAPLHAVALPEQTPALVPDPAPAPAPAPVAAPAPAREDTIQFHVRAATPVAAPAADQQRIEGLGARARQAIDAGRQDEAVALIDQLAALLPPESLTVLKLRAWQAMRAGRAAAALAAYQEIVARVPDDESSVLNLAILHWRGGRPDEARLLVAALAERHPDWEPTRQLLQQLGARP